MVHDRNFKELILLFFLEFIDLFLPEVGKYIDRSFEFVPMNKEMFSESTGGDGSIVDLLMKVKFLGSDHCFLIHFENEGWNRTRFGRRMFDYFADIHKEYDLPVYPVVVFHHDKPTTEEPSEYRVTFPDFEPLVFKYRTIQLNRFSSRDFLNNKNPVACALMAKMNMIPEDRPRVKLACLRLLTTLKLTPAKSRFIAGFVEFYLKLTAEEMKVFERELGELNPQERDETMELISSWEQAGIDKGIVMGIDLGRHEGKGDLLARQIRRRFGEISDATTERLDHLTSEQLNDLGEALFDFSSTSDLDQWLVRRIAN